MPFLHKLSLRTVLILPIILVIILSSVIIAYFSYTKNKQITVQSTEQQLQASVEVISEKITMLKATVPKQQFDKKLSYALTQNKNRFRSSSLSPMQFKLTKDQTIELFTEYRDSIPKLTKNNIKQIIQQRQGIIHDQGMMIAFAQQVELDGAYYIIALKDHDYLQLVNNYRIMLVVITSITVIIASLVGFFTIRRVTKPILYLKDLMGKVSSGDLRARIGLSHSSKELNLLESGFNQMVDRLHSIIYQLEESANRVTISSERMRMTASDSKSASEQIAIAMEEVVGGSEVQVKSAERVTNDVIKIANKMDQVSHSIHKVKESSQIAFRKAKTGNQLVDRTVEQIKLVNGSIESTAQLIHALNEKSNQIDHILNLIQELANHTNLLSLNATIEAARAGEHGKGFSVVAQEVKKLSNQSGQAVLKIKEITDEIRNETEDVVMAMKNGLAELKEGIDMVQQTEEAFADITNAVSVVTGETEDVSKIVSHVYSQTKDGVLQISNISAISQDFARSIQQVTAASEEQQASMEEMLNEAAALNDLSNKLEKTLKNFSIQSMENK
ncbi:methyl-accepting chemotaxis protein [Heyndrickxia oleronia]|jgi:methyl-accepting chemotaxis protein|uniref:methyl-accepting chemotaxis protein n=1 Tax=Heyndrickxia oleronia TaxID=38875 RepID=UPI00203FB837|nr:methyl-accepting chemotaxis protein [Heyndrickxia oleronia]MCI1590790.1 methyl-accepting chemotaxis protein [Heyndrickxia oleronia]MCI1612853.1 methyl-accepting chemotaxis protein [Heyndrickxia oleronia]MCI1744079.1 methyl-accepting chemotaxis protein [Heyndrickxia oleronia]MCI1761638.1 methyl-accepting chemotaxis protein [Heyndrickxia oleronia]MCM3454051.1 methyl-accepting chemotaxis protein [Heyndrickxia oleronia]